MVNLDKQTHGLFFDATSQQTDSFVPSLSRSKASVPAQVRNKLGQLGKAGFWVEFKLDFENCVVYLRSVLYFKDLYLRSREKICQGQKIIVLMVRLCARSNAEECVYRVNYIMTA